MRRRGARAPWRPSAAGGRQGGVEEGAPPLADTTEISTTLRYVIEELDQVAKQESIPELDLKKKILQDLRHLEKVVQSKIAEIEANLERL